MICLSWIEILQTKNQKTSRLKANQLAEETFGSVPHSFVFHRGRIGKNVGQLVMDMRCVMQPFTAESLKVLPTLWHSIRCISPLPFIFVTWVKINSRDIDRTGHVNF